MLASCDNRMHLSNSGVVVCKRQFFDTTAVPLHPVFTHSFKIWYKDSLAIEEIMLAKINTDINGKQTIKSLVEHYTFIDLRSDSFYEYQNFSDTAKITKKYYQPDSISVDGGWNFYGNNNFNYKDAPENLADTIINGISYKRVKFNRSLGNESLITIGYFRCDKKGSMFQFYKPYSEKIGCPMVKVYDFPVRKLQGPILTEVDFLSDTLSLQEQKIFEAWERNAKQNPVGK
jgi:hypothetical protein